MEQPNHIDRWSDFTRNKGYTPEFIEQSRRSRARAVKEELRAAGLSRLKRWGMPEWARNIVIEVCERTDVCPGEIASDARFQRVVKARREIIYRIKETKPILSTPQLGRWFNRDHTSILHSIAMHQEQCGAPRLVGYSLDKLRLRNRLWLERTRGARA